MKRGAAVLPAAHERLAAAARRARRRASRRASASPASAARTPRRRSARRRATRTATGSATPSSGASRSSATSISLRHLPRIFRRAGFELFYSEGFHPKPELSFGPALGLGIPSLGELVDVTLVDDVAPDELLRRLARVTLDGIEFLEAARARAGGSRRSAA